MALADKVRAAAPAGTADTRPTGLSDTRLGLAVGGGLGAVGLSAVLLPILAPAASAFVLPAIGAALLAGAAAVPVLIRRKVDQPLTDLALALGGGHAPLPHADRPDAIGAIARAANHRLAEQQRAISLDATVREIHAFSEAIQQMSHLFRKGHEDLSKHVASAAGTIEAATGEMSARRQALAEQVAAIDAAAEGVSKAGARVGSVAEKVAMVAETVTRDLSRAGDMMANAATDAVQMARDGAERQQRAIAESFRNLDTLLGKSAEAVIASLHEAAGRVAQEGTIQAERLHRSFSETDQRIAAVMTEGEARLKQAAGGLDEAAGALAHRLWIAAEAQDHKAAAFDAPLARIEALGATVSELRDNLSDTVERTERLVAATAAERGEMIRNFEARIDAVTEAVHALDLRLSYEANADDGVSTALRQRLDAIMESVHNLDLRLSYEANANDGVPAALKERLDRLSEAVHSLDVRLAYEETGRQSWPADLAGRVDAIHTEMQALKALAAAAPKSAAEPSPGVADKLELIIEAIYALDVRLSYEGMAEPSIPKQLNAKLDEIHEAIAAMTRSRASRRDGEAGDPPPLDLDGAARSRTLVAMRLILRELKDETQRLAGIVTDAAAAADKLQNPPAPALLETAPAANLPVFDAERSGLQRMLFGFRLLLRDIGLEAGRLREAVSQIDASADLAATDRPRPDAKPLETLLERLNDVVVGLDEKVTALVPAPRADEAPAMPQEAQPAIATGPIFDAEKTSMQRMLAGFRLLMRDIALETSAFRDAIGRIGETAGARSDGEPGRLGEGPAAGVLLELEQRFGALDRRVGESLDTLEARLARPLSETADRIALGVAESLSLLEQRLAEPIAALNVAVADSAEALRAIRGQAAPAAHAPPAAGSLPSLDRAIAVFAATGEAIEQRLSAIDDRLQRVTDALMGTDGAVEPDFADLAASMAAAAAELRHGAADIISVGAALSKELEASQVARVAEMQPLRASPPFRRRRA